MMGIVPVRINGSVDVYDELYASPSTPGFATSGQHLNNREKQSTALIGYAFQSLRMLDESEVPYKIFSVWQEEFVKQISNFIRNSFQPRLHII